MSEKGTGCLMRSRSSYEQKYYLNEAFSGLPDSSQRGIASYVCVVYGRCWRHFDTAV